MKAKPYKQKSSWSIIPLYLVDMWKWINMNLFTYINILNADIVHV